MIRDSIPAMDELRTLPDGVRRTLFDAGLFHLVLPGDVGGSDVPLPDALRIYEALAEIDASTAWCVAIGAGTASLGSMMDPSAARESIWSQPLGIVVGTFMPFGRAVREGDRYRVSGRWPFSSGCVGASWYIAYCVEFHGDVPRVDEEGNRVVVALPVPMGDCIIDETWDSPGLRGTGSHHVAIEAAWVPASQGFTLGAETQPGSPLHAFPFLAMLDSYLAAIMTGVVTGALNDLFEIFRLRAGEKGGLESFPASVALELAEVLAESKARRALVFCSVDELWQKVVTTRATGVPLDDDGLDVRLASKMAARRGPGLVSSITLMAGGRALVEAPGLQRRLRDAHAIASHFQYSTPVTAAVGHAAVQKYASGLRPYTR